MTTTWPETPEDRAARKALLRARKAEAKVENEE